MRTAAISRNTKETQIKVRLNLDGTGRCAVNTGIGFFDHMLEQIARHGLMDLEAQVEGDLYVDGHHTVEDAGIVFGQALKEALGDKKGIVRYGQACIPLDESLSRVVLDLSGRPGCISRVTSPAADDRRTRLAACARVFPSGFQSCRHDASHR